MTSWRHIRTDRGLWIAAVVSAVVRQPLLLLVRIEPRGDVPQMIDLFRARWNVGDRGYGPGNRCRSDTELDYWCRIFRTTP